jgi:hypothetical protein
MDGLGVDASCQSIELAYRPGMTAVMQRFFDWLYILSAG